MIATLMINRGDFQNDPYSKNIKKTEKAKQQLDKRIRIIFFIFQIIFGLAWSILISQFNLYGTSIAIAFSALSIVAVFFIIRKKEFTNDNHIMLFIRILVCLITIPIFLVVFDNNIIRMVSIAFVASLWNIFWAVDMGFLTRQAAMLSLPIKKHVYTSQIINNSGLIIGFLIGSVVDYSVFIIIGACFIVASSLFIPLNSHKNPDSIIEQQEKTAKSKQRLSKQDNDDMDKKIQSFSSHYQLTSRENEVFEQIIRGRSLKSISSNLQIAETTTKTHVYNLYKKLNIHTRYELMKLYDEFGCCANMA